MKKLDYITLYGPPMQAGYDIHVERKMHIFESETKAAVATIEHLEDDDERGPLDLWDIGDTHDCSNG